MGLGRALVDEGQALTRTATTKVAGRTQRNEVPTGATFRCRYDAEGAPEGGQGSASRVVYRPTLLVARRDRAGNPVRLNAGQRVVVRVKPSAGAGALWEGDRIFEVDGDPKPLRRRRRVIGYEVNVTRVVENVGATP